MAGEPLECCDDALLLQWREKDFSDGPEQDGWSINVSGVGDPYWMNIAFCPFCGTSVPE